MQREFGREVIHTGNVRTMGRDELEERLRGLRVPMGDTESDDQLRELLVSSVELDEARES